jgi:cytochrome c
MRYLLCLLLLVSLPGIACAADPVKGEQVFKSCAACHSIGPNAKNKLGPELNGIVGRKWASAEGYSYSQDLLAGKAQGNIWDADRLNKYIENPKSVAPRGKMPFAGIKDEKQREDLIAYLQQFNSSGERSH